jgi:hypothetical protein
MPEVARKTAAAIGEHAIKKTDMADCRRSAPAIQPIWPAPVRASSTPAPPLTSSCHGDADRCDPFKGRLRRLGIADQGF